MNKLFVIISLFAFGLNATAQEDGYDIDENIYDDIVPKHSFHIELGLPVGTSNKAFQSMLQGMMKFAPYYQFTFQNHISIGAGADYSFFRVDKFRVPEAVTGGIHNVGGFLKVGYEKFHSMRFGTDFGVKVGYSNAFFITDKNKSLLGKPNSINTIFVEPTAAVVLTAGEFTAYKFVVGYMFQGYDYRTQQLGISATGGYKPADLNHATQFMTFGFGFTYYFKQY